MLSSPAELLARSHMPLPRRETLPFGTPLPAPGSSKPGTRTEQDLRLLVDVRPVMRELIPAIASAREVVDVALFSLQPDGGGRELADALIAKARQGVEVNVVLDATGSFQIPGTPFAGLVREMREAGVNVKVTHPLKGGAANKYIDHRKMIVVDGKTAFIGGMNFAAMFEDWHDVMARAQGPVAAQAGALFLQRWADLGGHVTDVHRRATARAAGAHQARAGASAVMTNAPDRKHWALTDHYVQSIRNARTRIWLVTPFIGERRMIRELQAAALRGVDVRVMTSGRAIMNQPIIPLFTRSFYDELLASGVKVAEIPQVTHAKLLLVDGEATISSLNVSRRATKHDHEIGIASREPKFLRQVESLMSSNYARSKQFSSADLRSTAQRFVNGLTNLLDFEY
jgi:cardiolipin synthase A/B